MQEQYPQDQRIREATVERTSVGRVMAVGTVVLWLATLLRAFAALARAFKCRRDCERAT